MLGRKQGVPQLVGHDPRLGSGPPMESFRPWRRGHLSLRERSPPPPQKKNKKNSLLAEKCRTPNIRLCVSGEGVTTPAPTPTPLPWASWGTTSVVPENGGGLRVMDGDVNGVVVNNLADT